MKVVSLQGEATFILYFNSSVAYRRVSCNNRL